MAKYIIEIEIEFSISYKWILGRPTIYVVYIKGKENIYFPFFYAQKYYINSTIPNNKR